MLGIIYLILCMLTGMEMAGCLFPRQTTERGNRIWVVLPAAFGMGILMLTWAVYILSWMFSICAGARASSFLWKSDRISGRYPAAFGNLPVEKEKTAKNVCDIRTDDQQKWILKKSFCFLAF